MVKRIVTLAAVGFFMLSYGEAYAGKPERDKKDELEPIATSASTELTNLCGCPIKVNVDWDSYSTVDVMGRIKHSIESIVKSTKRHCEKAADKKATCDNLSGYTVRSGPSIDTVEDPTIKDKIISVQSARMTYTSDSQIDAILGSW